MPHVSKMCWSSCLNFNLKNYIFQNNERILQLFKDFQTRKHLRKALVIASEYHSRNR